MKYAIAILLVVITLILIVLYAILKFILDKYLSCINYMGDFIVKHLSMRHEMNKVSCFISNLLENESTSRV